jgi:hypothetical protein
MRKIHAIGMALAVLPAMAAQAQQTTDVVVMRRSLTKPNPKATPTPTPTPVATKSTCTRPVLGGGSFQGQTLLATIAETNQAKGLAWCESFATAQGCQYYNGTVYLVGTNSGTYTVFPSEPTRWSTVCRKN